jgi:hypothetical protein
MNKFGSKTLSSVLYLGVSQLLFGITDAEAGVSIPEFSRLCPYSRLDSGTETPTSGNKKLALVSRHRCFIRLTEGGNCPSSLFNVNGRVLI